MTIQERIRNLIFSKNMTLKDFHEKLKTTFQEKAITYIHLTRITSASSKTDKGIHEATLFQLAYCLNMDLRELKEGTSLESDFHRFSYNEKAWLDILNTKLQYLPARLVLKKDARTPLEQDPLGDVKYEKWIYCMSGELAVHVLVDESHGTYLEKRLRKEENFAFDSRKMHYFVNTGDKVTTCIVIQNPKYM